VRWPGAEATAEACAPFSTLRLRKQVVNDDGGSAAADEFTLTAAGTNTFSGTTGVTSIVDPGDHALSETGPDGYIADRWTCDVAAVTADVVTIAAGESVTCTIVNDDQPVDLELTKTDGGVTAVAGGDPFDYTLTIDNVGTRDVDLDEPVTVVDELPAGLLWVEPAPAGCTIAGQTLTCDVDPALLGVDDDPVVIVARARATR
jgi:uncharacterized repeat protein (TIGR01451 family)